MPSAADRREDEMREDRGDDDTANHGPGSGRRQMGEAVDGVGALRQRVRDEQ